jgi:hypothetical protein
MYGVGICKAFQVKNSSKNKKDLKKKLEGKLLLHIERSSSLKM